MRNKYGIISLVLITIWAIRAAASGADSPSGGGQELETVRDLPRKGRLALFNSRKAVEENDLERAAGLLEEYIEENQGNDHYILRFHLGTYLSRIGRDQEALENYQRAVELEPRYAQGWLNLGETAYQLEEFGLAAEAILKGFNLSEEKRGHLLYYASAAYIMDRKPLQAVGLLEDLISGRYGEPKMEWYRSMLSSCMDAGENARGRKAAESMIDKFPDDPEAWKLAFQFYAGTGDYRKAAVAMTVTGYLRPLESEEREQLGDIYSTLGIPEQAGSYYREAISDSSSARDYEKLASAYLAAYDYDAALATLQKALNRQPTVRLWALLGDLHYMDENYNEAYNAFEKCISLDREYGRAYLMMGYCALEMGRAEEAVLKLNAAAEFPEYSSVALKLLKRAEAERK